MPIPDSARHALARRLDSRRQQRWPELRELNLRYRGSFAYIEGTTTDDNPLPLCRLRYLGSDHEWGFAIYQGSNDGYGDWHPHRRAGRSPRLRLRPLPQRHHRMDRSTGTPAVRFTRELLTRTSGLSH